MKTTLKRVHVGLGLAEVGVQFETTSDDGIVTTQRAFFALDDAALAPVWLAAQTKLAEVLGTLPLDLPPGMVTSALMRARTARQAAEKARLEEQSVRAEIARVAADAKQELKRTKAEAAAIAEHVAEQVKAAEDLASELAAKRAAIESATLSESAAREASTFVDEEAERKRLKAQAKIAVLDEHVAEKRRASKELDLELEAKRVALEEAHTELEAKLAALGEPTATDSVDVTVEPESKP